MRILNIVTLPRKENSASTAIVEAFLLEFREHVRNVTVDRLDIWQERLPEFDAEAINAKYKGVSGESMTPVETATWEKIRELASRFQRADRIVLGVPMWKFLRTVGMRPDGQTIIILGDPARALSVQDSLSAFLFALLEIPLSAALTGLSGQRLHQVDNMSANDNVLDHRHGSDYRHTIA